jgi:hypothetical protein
MIPVYSGFGLDRIPVYSGFDLYRISDYSVFGLDMLHTGMLFLSFVGMIIESGIDISYNVFNFTFCRNA